MVITKITNIFNIIKNNWKDTIPQGEINLLNRNFMFILFLIYIHFFNQYVLEKFGKLLEKSSYNFLSKIGIKIHTSASYHIEKLNKIPLSFKIIDIMIILYFYGLINTLDKLNYLYNDSISWIIYIIIFIGYLKLRDFYYKKI